MWAWSCVGLDEDASHGRAAARNGYEYRQLSVKILVIWTNSGRPALFTSPSVTGVVSVAYAYDVPTHPPGQLSEHGKDWQTLGIFARQWQFGVKVEMREHTA